MSSISKVKDSHFKSTAMGSKTNNNKIAYIFFRPINIIYLTVHCVIMQVIFCVF